MTEEKSPQSIDLDLTTPIPDNKMDRLLALSELDLGLN